MNNKHVIEPSQAPQDAEAPHAKMLRHATRMTALVAFASAVMLPLLPSLTQSSNSRQQQLAQAAVDRVAAGGGMLWLDDDATSSASTAE